MTKLFLPVIWLLTILGGAVLAETKPIAHWDFSPANWADHMVTMQGGEKTGRAVIPPEFDGQWFRVHAKQSVDLDSTIDWTSEEFSIEATVRLEGETAEGSLFSSLSAQNGTGWDIAFKGGKIGFHAVAEGQTTTAFSETLFNSETVYHIVVTFSNRDIKLYVNGEVETEANGAWFAPSDEASLVVGTAENLSFTGGIREVLFYEKALPEVEVRERSRKHVSPDTLGFDFAVRPALQFVAPDEAKLFWETASPGRAAVFLGKTRSLGTLINAESSDIKQQVTLTDLEANTVYYYKIGFIGNGRREFSKTFEFNTAMNFTLPPVTGSEGEMAGLAEEILKASDARKGYALIERASMDEVSLAHELASQSDLVIYLFDDDSARVQEARAELMKSQIYGSRISVSHVENLAELPLTTSFASLVIVTGKDTSPAIGWETYVQPARGAFVRLNPEAVMPEGWRKPREPTTLNVSFRPPLKDRGSWSHQYGDPGNTASSGETLSGAKSTEDLVVQWVGRPGADFGIDRQSRMPAPLAVNGRLYHQGMNRLAVLDAYSGAILWSMEAPDLRRLNMPRDASNWCADDDHLYVAIRERAWMMDAQTGERIRTFQPSGATANHDWGYLAVVDGTLFGSSVRANTVYTDFWGGDQWFDEKSGPGTGKVCSDNLFAYDTETGQSLWRYEKGLIINPTIAIGGGKVFFVESRNPEVWDEQARQVTSEKLWYDQYLVALDAETGQKIWELPIDTEDGVITFYLQYHPEAVVITASNTAYHFYAFDPEDGSLLWERSNPWPDDHHSGFIQHPVIVNDTIFLQPNGYTLANGDIVTTNVGARSGCHTYIGTTGALIYRGKDREIAMWDQESEKVTTWSRLRPSCWLSFIAADGLLLVPEGGGGCSCGGWMETSLGFAPKSLVGSKTSSELNSEVPNYD